MNYQTMINVIAGTGLVLGPLSVMASDFGGGWMQDKDTGTLYYSHAPTPERSHDASRGVHSGKLNSFGGGWVQDKDTGTLYYSLAPTPERHQLISEKRQTKHLNGFGGGWAHDEVTLTFYHTRDL